MNLVRTGRKILIQIRIPLSKIRIQHCRCVDGYNFRTHKKDFANRDRIFLAGRYLNGYFPEHPDQAEYANEINYYTVNAYLTELTFYRQKYYRTPYVFGFGRTEDVPYGMSLSNTSGYARQIGIERSYFG